MMSPDPGTSDVSSKSLGLRRGNKKIRVVETGGTWTCETSDGGLAPSGANTVVAHFNGKLSMAGSLAEFDVPRLEDPGHFGKLIDSTNMSFSDQLRIIDIVHEALTSGEYDALIIIHGTDTLAYTGSLLSLVFPNPKFPIILTGAMKSIGEENTDAVQNFTDAVIAGTSDELRGGVYITFNKKLFPAHWASKINSEDFDAFTSVHMNKPLAYIRAGNIYFECAVQAPLEEVNKFYLPESVKRQELPTIGTIELSPSDTDDFLRRRLSSGAYDAYLVLGFGILGIPEDLLDALLEYSSTIPIILGSQIVTQVSDLKYKVDMAHVTLGMKNNRVLSPEMTRWGMYFIYSEVTSRSSKDGSFINSPESVQEFYRRWEEFQKRWGAGPI